MAKRKTAMDELVKRHPMPWSEGICWLSDGDGLVIQLSEVILAVNAAYPAKEKKRGKT